MAKGAKPSVEVGQKYTSKLGEVYEVVEYNSANKGVVIKFESTGNLMTCSAKEVKNGSVKNTMQKNVFGVACFGVGPWKAKVNGKFLPEYQLWIGLMTRIYHEPTLKDHPTYRSASICDEWHNFQNFAAWCQSQVGFLTKQANSKSFALDKDLLVPNNKVYSSETCCFLPNHINVALKGRQSEKGEQIPSGVYWHKASNSYTASANKNGKQYHLGCFATPEYAKVVFRKFKTEYLQELAEQYKDQISEAAYLALKNINLDERTIYSTAEG